MKFSDAKFITAALSRSFYALWQEGLSMPNIKLEVREDVENNCMVVNVYAGGKVAQFAMDYDAD